MHSAQVLEFDKVLNLLAERCETALGRRMALDHEPSFDEAEVWIALNLTGEAYELLGDAALPNLNPIKDLREPLIKAKKGAVLAGEDLSQIGRAILAIASLKAVVEGRKELEKLSEMASHLPDAKRLGEKLDFSLESDGEVKDSASTELAALRKKKSLTASRVQQRIQSYVSGKTRDLLSDPLYTTRDGRFVIPLKAENRGKIKGIVHDSSASGQTIYVEPEDVLQLGNQLREAEAAERAEIQRILKDLSSTVGKEADPIVLGVEIASDIDLALAKARLAYTHEGEMPKRLEKARFEVQGARHPLLDAAKVIPLDIIVGEGDNVLITGPNTGGKTVAIKTVGLYVLMLQCGMFPGAHTLKFGVFSQVWADIGDEQSLSQSLSTFSGHIKNISEALKTLKPGALVLLDEIGAGTDPAEGAALARSILLAMQKKEACILASTHYGELKQFAYETPGFQNAAMEFDSKTLQPTYRLRLGAPGASQALRIAEKYGIPYSVVEHARTVLGQQQQDITRMMESLENAQKRARAAQSEADKRSTELKALEDKANRKLKEAEDSRTRANDRAREAIENTLRELRMEAADLMDELKRSPGDEKTLNRVRKGLASIQERGTTTGKGFAQKEAKPGTSQRVQKGDSVVIRGYTQKGVVLEEPSGGKVQVQIGPLKMTVPAHQIQSIEATPNNASKRQVQQMQFAKAQTIASEVHLRHMRAEDATPMLEKYLDEAVLAGSATLRIVHGKGEGVLRKITQDVLRKHPDVASYEDADATAGGHGVTIVRFK